MTPAKLFVPDYVLDLQTARADPSTSDWRADDLDTLMVSGTVSRAAVDLHDRAGRPPTLVYVPGSVCLRVTTGHFAIAGRRAQFLETDVERDKVQQAFADLLARRIELLATRRAYQPGPPMTGIAAVMFTRPTQLKEPFHAFLGRLEPAEDGSPITVIDLAGNIERLGAPVGWQVETITCEAKVVVADPALDRLSTMPMAAAQRWAEGDRGRLAMVAAARGYKPAWVTHSVEAWHDKEVRSRSRQSTPLDRRPGREARAQPPP